MLVASDSAVCVRPANAASGFVPATASNRAQSSLTSVRSRAGLLPSTTASAESISAYCATGSQSIADTSASAMNSPCGASGWSAPGPLRVAGAPTPARLAASELALASEPTTSTASASPHSTARTALLTSLCWGMPMAATTVCAPGRPRASRSAPAGSGASSEPTVIRIASIESSTDTDSRSPAAACEAATAREVESVGLSWPSGRFRASPTPASTARRVRRGSVDASASRRGWGSGRSRLTARMATVRRLRRNSCGAARSPDRRAPLPGRAIIAA